MIPISVTFYEEQSGKIKSVYRGTEDSLALQSEYGVYPYVLGDFSGNDFYVNVETETANPRLEMPLITIVPEIIADGQPQDIISEVPIGSSVTWPDGYIERANNDTVTFGVDLPGTYTFRLTAVPYLDQEVVIEAIAAT